MKILKLRSKSSVLLVAVPKNARDLREGGNTLQERHKMVMLHFMYLKLLPNLRHGNHTPQKLKRNAAYTVPSSIILRAYTKTYQVN